jgi:hypothetical protein
VRIRRSTCAAALAALILGGCGQRHLVLQVDVLSYLDPSATQAAFGPVPAVPGGFATGEQTLVGDTEVNLFEGLTEVADIQEVVLRLSTVVRDSTGSGTDTLRVYASALGTAPRSLPPLMERAIVLSPGVTDTVDVTLENNPRLNELFAGRRMIFCITTSLRGPASGADLHGWLRVQALDAVVIAGRDAP